MYVWSMQLLLSIFADIVLWLEKHLLTCPSRKFLHIDCPGCGLQRSYIALLKGNVAESLRLYPAAIPILILFVFSSLHLYFKYPHGAKWITRMYITNVVIILVHYIYKIVHLQIFHA